MPHVLIGISDLFKIAHLTDATEQYVNGSTTKRRVALCHDGLRTPAKLVTLVCSTLAARETGYESAPREKGVRQ
jgi:hypothetical protein